MRDPNFQGLAVIYSEKKVRYKALVIVPSSAGFPIFFYEQYYTLESKHECLYSIRGGERCGIKINLILMKSFEVHAAFKLYVISKKIIPI